MGKYLSIWGVKAIFPAGFIIDGGTFILFGLLEVNVTNLSSPILKTASYQYRPDIKTVLVTKRL